MVKFLWGLLVLAAGLVWLKMSGSSWLGAQLILRLDHTEIQTSLWVVIVAIFAILVLVYTFFVLWFGVVDHLKGNQVSRALKAKAQWEDVISKLLTGQWLKAIPTCQKLAKSQGKTAALGAILATWLEGMLFESSADIFAEKTFPAEDFVLIQPPIALQAQWSGQGQEAQQLWQQIFKQAPISVVFLKVWLQGVMSQKQANEALATAVTLVAKHKTILWRHYPEFSQEVQIYLFGNAAYQDESALLNAWRDVPRANRRMPDLLIAYVQACAAGDCIEQAQKLIEQDIPKNWSPEMCAEYAKLALPVEGQIKMLNRWLKYAPPECHGSLYAGLGYAYCRSKIWDQARQMLEKTVAEQGGQSSWGCLLALVYMKLQQFSSAQTYLLNNLPFSSVEVED